MDKKSITGLVIIAGILIAFAMFGPKAEQAEETNTEQTIDSTENNQSNQVEEEQEFASNLVPQLDDEGNPIIDTIKGQLYKDTVTDLDTFIFIPKPQDAQISANDEDEEDEIDEPTGLSYQEKVITLENDLLIVDFSSVGGRIKNVYLKEFVSYQDYISEKKTPLQLFDSTSSYGLSYPTKNKDIFTDEAEFTIKSKTASEIVLETTRKGKTIGYSYKLNPGKYDIDYDIYFKGFTDKEVADIKFNADFKLMSTEKHFPTDQRNSVIFWQYEGEGYDYIHMKDDYELEEKTEWIAFRQSFFTAILTNYSGFSPKNSTVEILDIADEKQTKYAKQFLANVNLGASNANNTMALSWYMGPVDYEILASYDSGVEDLVELGPGLFRWINKYFMLPLFSGLLGLGVSVGLAILLLTLVVKLILSPVNYKMYKSTAMMKVLKPQIEKINEEFPKKEDAMKKQQATMGLYRETGVSPLAGCIPMLIQMPILFAIFRLFPSSIELRQKSFLWAEDLSSYDAIATWDTEIWGLSAIYGNHISLFTLLMAATTLLYTHYNSANMQQPSQPGMPNMKYIMYFFPFMMIFFFNSYSSGLSFYYFISTLMTIGIMFAIKKFFIDEEKLLAKLEEKKANPKKKGKSKFQERLEEAQRLQQEKMKNRKK